MTRRNIEPDAGQLRAAYLGTHLEEFAGFLPELNKESDRGIALVATSFIDDLLKRTLKAFLIKGKLTNTLFDGMSAPLSTFAARIAMAHALGLISDQEAADADRLRSIRNRFAHDMHVSFTDEKVAAECKKLILAAHDYGKVVVGPRGQFATSATSVILNLVNRPHYVAEKRRTFEPWPF
jgi:hypothetical protein